MIGGAVRPRRAAWIDFIGVCRAVQKLESLAVPSVFDDIIL